MKWFVCLIQAAIDLINSQGDQLSPTGLHFSHELLLIGNTRRGVGNGSFLLSKLVCQKMEDFGMHLIMGPLASSLRYSIKLIILVSYPPKANESNFLRSFSSLHWSFFSSSYVQSICDAMDVPHILTHSG
jgi:hypothetical protein